MSFLAPLGFLALLTLPIILILHLMRERRRRVIVPSLLLWQLLPQRREAQRRKRLPLTLLLLLHLLAAALIALALAHPQVAFNFFGGEQHLALVIDTSTSMAAGDRFERARAAVGAQLSGLAGRDSVVLISAGPQAAVIGRAGATDAPLLRAELDNLRPAGTGSDIVGALTLAEAALQGLPDSRVIVFTDAAIPDLAATVAQRSGSIPIIWQTTAAPLANRAVVNLAARDGAGGSVQIYARAVNYGDETLQTTLRLYGDDALLDTRVVTFQPRGEVELTWSLPPGPSILRVEVDGRDALPIDDVSRLRLANARPLQALLVSATPAALERVLRAIPDLDVQVVDPATYSPQMTADLTVFAGVLPDSWPEGAVLAIDPPAGTAVLEVGSFRREPPDAVVRAAPETDLFAGISLGSVEFGSAADVTPPAWAQVLLSRAEQPLILRGRVERSEIAIWAFDPERGNLTNRLAFPLLTARTVRSLIPPPLPAAVTLGVPFDLQPDPRADVVVLRGPDGSEQQLTPLEGRIGNLALFEVGNFTMEERLAGEVLYRVELPVSAGSPQESALAPQPLPPDRPPVVATGADLEELGRPLWPWLAAAALIVGMVEWFYVHAARRPGVGS
ncbi:MAG: VWA domain-containing protein [Oscillochloris sp.]|nr:VWA domain-containing protein [Oscillochloris sp.]